LRIPPKLLKNNESVVVKMFDENKAVPLDVSSVPLLIEAEEISCFCICRIDNPKQTHIVNEQDILPEQLIFC